MEKKKCEPCPFIGVFIVGLILLGVTANYCINKEPGEEREARNRRIANELDKIHHTSSSVAKSLQGH